MLISPAFAQTATSNPLGSITQFLPLVLIFVVFYFLLIRPQQQKQKQVRAQLSAIKRGDRVVTGGGILGTVSKAPHSAEEREIEVEIAQGMKVVVLRETITAVVNPQPKPANDARPKSAAAAEAKPGVVGFLTGFAKGVFGKKG